MLFIIFTILCITEKPPVEKPEAKEPIDGAGHTLSSSSLWNINNWDNCTHNDPSNSNCPGAPRAKSAGELTKCCTIRALSGTSRPGLCHASSCQPWHLPRTCPPRPKLPLNLTDFFSFSSGVLLLNSHNRLSVHGAVERRPHTLCPSFRQYSITLESFRRPERHREELCLFSWHHRNVPQISLWNLAYPEAQTKTREQRPGLAAAAPLPNFPEVTMDRSWNPCWFSFVKHNFY